MGITNDVIYHYTGPQGLIGILSDGQFWATDIKYLNDSSEELHAEAMFQKFLENLDDDPDERVIAELCLKIVQRNRRPSEPMSRTAAHDDSTRRHWLNELLATYVVCFSSHEDSVYMWNTHGSGGSGFSVGVDGGNWPKRYSSRRRPTNIQQGERR
jgi:hypothetical protein